MKQNFTTLNVMSGLNGLMLLLAIPDCMVLTFACLLDILCRRIVIAFRNAIEFYKHYNPYKMPVYA